MKLVQRRAVLGIAALALTLGGVTTAHAVPVNKCAAAKTKCVSAKVKGLLGCHQKAESKGFAVDPTCIDKVVTKFSACIVKPDAKPPCLTTNDGATLEAAIDAYVLDVVQELDPGYPTPVTNKCSVAKKKAVAAKTAAKLGCLAKAFGKEPGTIDPACITKAETKFAGAWAKADAKPPCLTTGDEAALETKVDVFYSSTSGMLGVAVCGNGSNDASEACDASAPSSGWAQCGPEFTCTDCNCGCPTTITFAGDAAAQESILDSGWTGISHRAPIVSDGDVTVNLSCAATSRPCGTCAVSGPIANTGSGKLASQRCSGDTAVPCTNAPGGTGGPCTGLGTCEFWFGSHLSLAAGGVTTCVTNQFNGPVNGTANVESGEAATTALLTSRVYSGIAIDHPCPRCLGDVTINDGVAGGTCDGGDHVNDPCDANGSFPGRPDFGSSSLDCPPLSAGLLATLGIDLTNATDPVTKTLTTSSPNCTGAAGKCLCDTCNDANADACDDNADCPDPPGPIGPICGGRRCLSGVNAGTACTANSECPGGTCTRPGEPTKPNGCSDDSMTGVYCDDPDADGVGECRSGPTDQTCSLASGHPQRGCTNDASCGGALGSCESHPRKCFLTGGGSFPPADFYFGTDTLIATGMEDPPMGDVSNATLGAVFCVGPTGAAAVNNIAGLPGPARVTIKGQAAGHP